MSLLCHQRESRLVHDELSCYCLSKYYLLFSLTTYSNTTFCSRYFDKVIMCAMKDLDKILKNGSLLYRKYLAATENQTSDLSARDDQYTGKSSEKEQNGWSSNNSLLEKKSSTQSSQEPSLNFMEIISYNSALGNLTALQKRHLESLADGPRYFVANQSIWGAGAPVDFSFLIVSGTAHFFQPNKQKVVMNRRGSTGSIALVRI